MAATAVMGMGHLGVGIDVVCNSGGQFDNTLCEVIARRSFASNDHHPRHNLMHTHTFIYSKSLSRFKAAASASSVASSVVSSAAS